jgi:PKD repeat protein
MKIHISKWRTPSFTVLTGTLSLMAVLSAPVAHAESGYVRIWNDIYPGSSAADNADCQLCHAASTRNLNPYGETMCSSNAGSISNRIQDVESMNSDADPTGSNDLAEINAGTQPGWTPGNVNLTYNRGDCSETGNVEAPPTFIPGDLDPAAGNQPPMADAKGPYSGTVNIPLTLDGTASSDSDGTIVSYDWDFGDGIIGTGASPTHTYLSDGTFDVTLIVTDDAGDTGTAGSTATIGLGNQPPVAKANGPYSGTVGETVTFDGTGSSDPDGSIASYSWNFGDGNSGTGPSPTHTYTSAGMFNVTLMVMDDIGATDSAASTADIVAQPVNRPPVADANGPYTGTVGDSITFDGSASNDPDGSIVDYSWDFGDGYTGSGETPTHTYSSDGNYTVTLTVMDDAGDTGTATSTASIGAVNQLPVANPNGPYTGTVATAVTLDSSGSNDPDGSIVDYSWDFGDGYTGNGETPTHSYSSDGNYTATLTVTDDAGDTVSATTTASIGAGNLPPVADPNDPYNGMAGVPVAFDGGASSDPDGTIVAYNWDFGDGKTGSGATPSHSYIAAGTFNVTLEVMDDSGAVDSAMTTATIVPVDTGPDPTGADVFLKRLRVSGRVDGRPGRTMSQRVMAIGDGDTLAQDATVRLTVMSPAGVTVAVNPASRTKMVSPEDGATRYKFRTDITCDAPGTYVLEWTAMITAAENSDPGNDILTGTTSVRCKGKQPHAVADEEDDDKGQQLHADANEENDDEDDEEDEEDDDDGDDVEDEEDEDEDEKEDETD